ncbi:MAG: hypothetical protein IPN48_16220 [Sphingomonadales bacterium]|nr:hypothetical protein [Sphingomonadales bacterium]
MLLLWLPAQFADDAGAADAAMHGDAPGPSRSATMALVRVSLEADFRMRMNIAADRHEIVLGIRIRSMTAWLARLRFLIAARYATSQRRITRLQPGVRRARITSWPGSLEAAQHEGRPPLRIFHVVDAQIEIRRSKVVSASSAAAARAARRGSEYHAERRRPHVRPRDVSRSGCPG